MADTILSNPNQRLVNNRFDDVECHNQTSDIEIPSSSFKTILKRRKIIIISTFSLILLAVTATILSAVFIVKANQAKTFKKDLESLLDKNLSFLDAETKERYVDDMLTLFKKGYVSSEVPLEFDTYVSFQGYNSLYAIKHATENERRERFYNYRLNYRELRSRTGKELYQIEMNRFSDMTRKELNQLFPKLKVPKVKAQSEPLTKLNFESTENFQKKLKLAKGEEDDVSDLTKVTGENIDWRKASVVSKVRDQGLNCSSAWAFASVSAVESLFKIHKDRDYLFAPQELLNCDFKSNGCKGGDVSSAFEYMTKGIDYETYVPYTGASARCKALSSSSKSKIGSQIFMTGADILNKSLVISPTVVYLSIGREFLAYKSGLYDGPCGKSPNHAVLLVGEGLDTQTNKRYWIIKNSWGEAWGERGFARLVRTEDKFDKCDILKVGFNPSFVQVESQEEKEKAAKVSKLEKKPLTGKSAKTEKKGF